MMNYVMGIIIGLGSGLVLFKLIGAISTTSAAALTEAVTIITK